MANERYEVRIPPFTPPSGHIVLQSKIEERIISLIKASPEKQEYEAMKQQYPTTGEVIVVSPEVIEWHNENRPRIHALLQRICSEVGLPETSIPMLELHYFLHDSGLLPSSEIAPYRLAVRTDLAWPCAHTSRQTMASTWRGIQSPDSDPRP